MDPKRWQYLQIWLVYNLAECKVWKNLRCFKKSLGTWGLINLTEADNVCWKPCGNCLSACSYIRGALAGPGGVEHAAAEKHPWTCLALWRFSHTCIDRRGEKGRTPSARQSHANDKESAGPERAGRPSRLLISVSCAIRHPTHRPRRPTHTSSVTWSRTRLPSPPQPSIASPHFFLIITNITTLVIK